MNTPILIPDEQGNVPEYILFKPVDIPREAIDRLYRIPESEFHSPCGSNLVGIPLKEIGKLLGQPDTHDML